ncbi:MAG: fasciclin domain-containing protein [Calothrix sp. C42_A2020_038]|nr:fasciclin domain-containing protein [Calothrix sp. C42_A2020_038]
MFSYFRRLLASSVMVMGVTLGAVSPLVISTSAQAQQAVSGNASDLRIPSQKLSQAPTLAQGTTNFPDVSQDFWARPFIQALAERNIIVGFPDGTYRPQQPVTRAEFAAIILRAFNQNPIRQLPTGGFRDVPSGFWAANAITRAYETGFLSGYPDNTFRPNLQITKVQAVVSLASGLGLSGGDTATLANFYADAGAIPNYALNQVAGATQARVVVNYPDIRLFNPEVPLTRADAAAHVYQALVRQGQLQPIASNLPAAQYIVGSTQTGNDIVSTATASNSFNTLASLLQTAGLAESLQQGGPFTVFAPTDEAFAALPQATLERLQQPENRETLIRILTYHVVPGQLTASQLRTGEINTAEGRPVNVNVNVAENRVTINNAQVTQADIAASNGVIHAINRVLLPSDISLDLGTPGQPTITPGRATRGGRSYIGAAGNIGLRGDSALSEGNIAVISKIGLTNNFSVRPGAVFGDNTVVLVPLTFDLAPRSVSPTGEVTFGISPYLGAGVAIDTSNDADVGLLLTGGVDVPLATRFTLNGAVNAAFLDRTDVGIQLGVGFNF